MDTDLGSSEVPGLGPLSDFLRLGLRQRRLWHLPSLDGEQRTVTMLRSCARCPLGPVVMLWSKVPCGEKRDAVARGAG